MTDVYGGWAVNYKNWLRSGTPTVDLAAQREERIAQLEKENAELKLANENLHKHASMLEGRCDFWNKPMG